MIQVAYIITVFVREAFKYRTTRTIYQLARRTKIDQQEKVILEKLSMVTQNGIPIISSMGINMHLVRNSSIILAD